MSKFALHTWDDNAVCTHCGFDSAEFWWWLRCQKGTIGEDEYAYRRANCEEYKTPVCTKLREED